MSWKSHLMSLVALLIAIPILNADLLLLDRDFYGSSEYSDPETITVQDSTFRLGSDTLFKIGNKLVIEGESCIESDTTVCIDARPPIVDIHGGDAAFYIVRANGDVWACGSGASGQLANGQFTSSEANFVKCNVKNVKSVEAGLAHVLFLTIDGAVYSCGKNKDGQLGIGSNEKQATPVKIIESGAKQISCGWSHSLVLMEDGTVFAFGSNGSGELGDGTQVDKNTPVQVLLSDVEYLYAGKSGSHFVKADGSVYGCGHNKYGECGVGSSELNIIIPTLLTGISDVVKIAGGLNFNMFLKSNGELYSCGYGNSSSPTIGYKRGKWYDIDTPEFIRTDVEDVFAGRDHHGIITSEGVMYSIGNNSWGQLAKGTNIDYYASIYRQATVRPTYPTQYAPVYYVKDQSWGIQKVSTWGTAVLMLSNTGEVWGAGWNHDGRLGYEIGTLNQARTFVKTLTGFEINR